MDSGFPGPSSKWHQGLFVLSRAISRPLNALIPALPSMGAGRHPQVRQCKQRFELQRVFLQSPVAHFYKPELALDHAKRVLEFLHTLSDATA